MAVTVTIIPPGGHNKFGDPTPPVGAETTVPNCKVAPKTVDDVINRGREGQQVSLTLYAPSGTRVPHDAKVRITESPYAGTYTVTGEPEVWVWPFSLDEAGVAIPLQRSAG